jgi:hypothetical protein
MGSPHRARPEDPIMRLSTRFTLALTLLGTVLCDPGSASPVHAETDTQIYLGIKCQGIGTQGIAEVMIGDPDDKPAHVRLTCSHATPRSRAAITVPGDPEDMPWSVKVTMVKASGESTICEQLGTRPSMKTTCRTIGDPNRAIVFGASAVGDPDLSRRGFVRA